MTSSMRESMFEVNYMEFGKVGKNEGERQILDDSIYIRYSKYSKS